MVTKPSTKPEARMRCLDRLARVIAKSQKVHQDFDQNRMRRILLNSEETHCYPPFIKSVGNLPTNVKLAGTKNDLQCCNKNGNAEGSRRTYVEHGLPANYTTITILVKLSQLPDIPSRLRPPPPPPFFG